MVEYCKTEWKNMPEKKKTPGNLSIPGVFPGASDLTRTGDLLITSEMHYRLCYTSIYLAKIL